MTAPCGVDREDAMSVSELERLEADLSRDLDLRREMARLGGEPIPVAEWARSRGYQLTPGQLRKLLGSQGELSDDDLEQVAGGDDPWVTSGGGSGGGGG
jgi:hypothetical protein